MQERLANLAKRAAGNQIPGARDYQEDQFEIRPLHTNDSDELFLILADGMGGHAGGARASELAVSTFVACVARAAGAVTMRLRQSLDAANAAIAEDAAQNPHHAEMGCTLLVCRIADHELHWLSVGDSPLWLLRGGEMTRLNADHSMRPVLQDLVELGRMSAEDLEGDRRINQLRSALIGEEIAMVDQNETAFTLADGDQIIAASDGLETLSVDEIGAICAQHGDPTAAVAALLDEVEARQRAGQDNTTAVIYQHINFEGVE